MLSPLALLLIKSMPINIDEINNNKIKKEKNFEIFVFPEFIFRSPLVLKHKIYSAYKNTRNEYDRYNIYQCLVRGISC